MACGIDNSGTPTFVGTDQLVPSGPHDASNLNPFYGVDQLKGGSFAGPAHLATPEADLLAHLQTAPISSPVFDNLNAPHVGPAADPLTPPTLDSGMHAAVDTVSNILDHGVDYVQLLGVQADPAHDDMQALLDHLQHPNG